MNEDVFIDKDALPKITCPICLDILNEPVRDLHGHIFFRDCIETALENSPDCRLSRSPIEDSLSPAEDIKNQIQSVSVLCANFEEECK